MLPGWTHHPWDDSRNAGLVAAYFPRYADQYEQVPFGVVKSDIARYVYLHAFGGFYLDTDYKLFRPLDDALRAHRCLIP